MELGHERSIYVDAIYATRLVGTEGNVMSAVDVAVVEVDAVVELTVDVDEMVVEVAADVCEVVCVDGVVACVTPNVVAGGI